MDNINEEECIICKIDKSQFDVCDLILTCRKIKKHIPLYKTECCGKLYHQDCMATYIVNKRNIFFSDIQKEDNDEHKDICPHCCQFNKYPIEWGFTYENNKIIEKIRDFRIYMISLYFMIVLLMLGIMMFSIFSPVNLVEKGCNNLFENNRTNDVKECNNQIIKNNTEYRKYQSYSGVFNSIMGIFNIIILLFIYGDLYSYKVKSISIFKNWENVYNKYINKYYYKYYVYTIKIYKEKHNYDLQCLIGFKKYVKWSVIFTIILITNNIFIGVYIKNYKIENITSIEQIVDIVGDNIYVLTINSNTIFGLLLLIMFMVIIIIWFISTRNELINNNKIMTVNNDLMPNIKIISIDLDENIKDKQYINN